MTKISWRFLFWLAWALLVCATASTFYTSSAAQLPKWPKIPDASQKLADTALTKFINANQPIDYNYGALFPQVALPGTAFAPSNGAQVAAESAQLAQSANGEIDLASGDYALPVRLYCTHIYTGTAPGLNYLLAQLNGKRAHVITMLTGRTGYNRLPYKPVQVLSWAIQNGQKYGDFTPVLRKLVDDVIPDQRAALGDDLVEQVSTYWNDYARGHRGLPDFETELHRLPAGDQILKYERAKNAMSQHPDDYDALRNEFILEGQAPAAQGSDPPWSQVRPGVLERLIPPEGRWIGGVGTLQIRVLPTSAPTVAVPVTDIIGYPPNSMQPVTFSIVDLPGNAPEKSSGAPSAPGAPPVSSASAPTPTATADSEASTTVIVQGNQSWTPTNISVDAGTTVKILASGGVSFSAGSKPSGPAGYLPDCLTVANGPYGWRARPYVANQLPCSSLLGRIGETGSIFYVGAVTTFRAATSGKLYLGVNDNNFSDNSGNWTAVITVLANPVAASPASQITSNQPGNMRARVAQALIAKGGTSLELPPGQMYLYGMATGGGAPTSEFATGQYAKVLNTAGLLSAALAYGPNSQNSYTTQTAYHDIAGVSVAGAWRDFVAYYGANHKTGAHDASVSFQTNEDSLVVVLGLASGQQFAGIEGLPNLQVDASGDGSGIAIAHAYVKPGTYNVVENSKVLAAGQDPAHMTDLVGVFVFSGTQENEVSTAASDQPQVASVGGTSKGNIRSVDFQNFSYESNCSEKVDPAFGKVIPATNGSWKNASLEAGNSLSFSVVKVFYGDVKGDGQTEAVVHTACLPPANWDYEELSVFEMSGEGPRLLARLTPGEGLADHGPRYDVVRAEGGELDVSYQVTGEHGFGACPEWTVTERFHWNGSSFASTGQSRKKNSCAQ